MYIAPKYLRGLTRFDLGHYRPHPKSPAERYPAAPRKKQ